jgi:hypothetical protein
MSISILIEDTVKFPVKGTERNAQGVEVPFTFTLVCDRLDADAVQAIVENDQRKLADFFADITQDWDGVKDADGKKLPYTADHLAALFKKPGLAALTFRTYLTEIGAKAKN